MEPRGSVFMAQGPPPLSMQRAQGPFECTPSAIFHNFIIFRIFLSIFCNCISNFSKSGKFFHTQIKILSFLGGPDTKYFLKHLLRGIKMISEPFWILKWYFYVKLGLSLKMILEKIHLAPRCWVAPNFYWITEKKYQSSAMFASIYLNFPQFVRFS